MKYCPLLGGKKRKKSNQFSVQWLIEKDVFRTFNPFRASHFRSIVSICQSSLPRPVRSLRKYFFNKPGSQTSWKFEQKKIPRSHQMIQRSNLGGDIFTSLFHFHLNLILSPKLISLSRLFLAPVPFQNQFEKNCHSFALGTQKKKEGFKICWMSVPFLFCLTISYWTWFLVQSSLIIRA